MERSRKLSSQQHTRLHKGWGATARRIHCSGSVWILAVLITTLLCWRNHLKPPELCLLSCDVFFEDAQHVSTTWQPFSWWESSCYHWYSRNGSCGDLRMELHQIGTKHFLKHQFIQGLSSLKFHSFALIISVILDSAWLCQLRGGTLRGR